jgi:pimeloyl-ACP methyl ester carboxylesterase
MNIIEKHVSICGQNIRTKQIILDNNHNLPVIIMLHDALGSVSQWKNFPVILAEKTGLNILLYDRQGHGKTSKRYKPITKLFFLDEALSTLPQLITKFKLNKFILYGHSDGGTIALLFAANRHMPKPIALIAEASHVFNEEKTVSGIKNTLKNSPAILQKLKKYHDDKTETLYFNWSNLWLSENMKNWNILSKLKTIDIPTLIIQGKNDEYGTINQVNGILENIKNKGEKLLVEECGHFPHKEKPKLIIEKINSFLNPILY